MEKVIGENSLSESVESDSDDESTSAEPPIGVRKALRFMDQVQGLASSIGNPDMLSAVADVITLLEQHTINNSKQTDMND